MRKNKNGQATFMDFRWIDRLYFCVFGENVSFLQTKQAVTTDFRKIKEKKNSVALHPVPRYVTTC